MVSRLYQTIRRRFGK